MNRSTHRIAYLLLVIVLSAPLHAQLYPATEAYLGFTVVNNPYDTDRHNSPGVVFNFGYSLTRNMRLVADMGAEYHDTNIVWPNGRKASADDYQLLFGPEYVFRRSEKFTPFVHGLAGWAWRKYTVPSDNYTCTGFTCYQESFSVASESGFAGAVGGGLDWNAHPRIAVRLVQFDWIRSHLSRNNDAYAPVQPQLPTLQEWQNSYRFSCGITFRWGTRGASM